MNVEAARSTLGSTIGGVARRVFVTQVLLGVLTCTVICAGVWMALFLLDNFLRLPPAIRFPLALGGAAVTCYAVWRHVIRTIRGRKTRDQIAVMLERKYGIGGNVVINALQFGDVPVADAQRPFVERTVDLGAGKLGKVSLRDLAETRRLLKWAGLALGALLLVGGYVAFKPQHFGNAVSRYFFSLSDVPPASSLKLTVTPGEDIAIAETEDVEVRVVVDGLKPGQPLEEYPELCWREGLEGVPEVRGKGSRVIMHPVDREKNTYRHRFACVRNSFSFRVFVSDAYSRSVSVSVAPAPRITASQCRVTLPWYTGGRVASALGPPNPVECLPESTLDIELEMNRPCRSVSWRTGDGTLAFTKDGDAWRVRYPVKRGGPYDVEIEADDLDRPINVASGVMSLLSDEPPSIDILDTVTNRTVTPGEKLTVKVRAQDYYGLRYVRITSRPARGGADPRTLRSWSYGDSKTVKVAGGEFNRAEIERVLAAQVDANPEMIARVVEHYTTILDDAVRVDFPPGTNKVVHETTSITIDASVFEPGYKYYIEAVARDFCPGNEESVSKALMITVRNIDGVSISDDAELGKLYGFLDEAIKRQREAINHTDTFLTHADSVWLDMRRKPYEDPKKVQQLLGLHRRNILKEQTEVRNALYQAMMSARGVTSPIVDRIRDIYANEAVDANDRASMLNGLKYDLGLGAPVHLGRMEGTAVSLRRPARGRYLGFLVETAARWNDRSMFSRLGLWDVNGKAIPHGGWKVKEVRGGQKIEVNVKPWAGAGPMPHFLVVDLGKIHTISRFEISRDKTEVGRYKLYLAESWSGRVSVPERPDRDIALKTAGSLKRVQQLIYNQLIALKGREIVKKEYEDRQEAERALLGEQVEMAPVPDDARDQLKEDLRDWKVRHDRNAELRKKLMNDLAENFTEETAEALEEAVCEKEIQARELKDYINNFTTGAFMDEGDTQQAKINAEILNKLEEIRQLENEAVAAAKGGDFTESLDDQISLGAEGIAGKSDKSETAKSGDVPGGAEQPEDASTPPYTPKLSDSMKATVDELAEQLDSIAEDVSYATTSMSGALGQNPDDNIIGGQYSSYASAGQMGDITPNPMKNASGRSGVGRSGQADGQFTGDSAPLIPDDEVAMPNRMSETAAEGGADIKDEGAAPETSVGMGKSTSRVTDFGKSGRLSPEFLKRLKNVGEEVEKFEESCEDMLMNLAIEGLPVGDLKTAMMRMRSLMEAMKKGDGVGIRQAFDEAVAHVKKSRSAILREMERRSAENRDWDMERDHVARKAMAELKGYEEIIAEYFKQLAETRE